MAADLHVMIFFCVRSSRVGEDGEGALATEVCTGVDFKRKINFYLNFY